MKRAQRAPVSTLVCVLLIAVYGIPLLYLVATSFKSNNDIGRSPWSLVFAPTLEGFRTSVEVGILHAMFVSGAVALGTTVIVTVLAALGAYWLSISGSRWVEALLFLLIVIQMVPAASTVLPLFRIFGQLRLTGNYLAVMLAIAILLLPFAVLLLRPFYDAAPIEVLEASVIDGAGQIRTFVSVVLPMVRNGIVTIGLLVFMIAWGDFVYSINFLPPTDLPTSAVIASRVSFALADWSSLMASSLISIVPILLIFVLFQRRITDGLAKGAVKG